MISAVDPDLQIKRGPGHPDRDIRGGGGGRRFKKKNFLRPFGHQFGLKIRGAQAPLAPPLDLPLDLNPLFSHFYLDLFSVTYMIKTQLLSVNSYVHLGDLPGKNSRELAEIPDQYNLI